MCQFFFSTGFPIPAQSTAWINVAPDSCSWAVGHNMRASIYNGLRCVSSVTRLLMRNPRFHYHILIKKLEFKHNRIFFLFSSWAFLSFVLQKVLSFGDFGHNQTVFSSFEKVHKCSKKLKLFKTLYFYNNFSENIWMSIERIFWQKLLVKFVFKGVSEDCVTKKNSISNGTTSFCLILVVPKCRVSCIDFSFWSNVFHAKLSLGLCFECLSWQLLTCRKPTQWLVLFFCPIPNSHFYESIGWIPSNRKSIE